MPLNARYYFMLITLIILFSILSFVSDTKSLIVIIASMLGAGIFYAASYIEELKDMVKELKDMQVFLKHNIEEMPQKIAHESSHKSTD